MHTIWICHKIITIKRCTQLLPKSITTLSAISVIIMDQVVNYFSACILFPPREPVVRRMPIFGVHPRLLPLITSRDHVQSFLVTDLTKRALSFIWLHFIVLLFADNYEWLLSECAIHSLHALLVSCFLGVICCCAPLARLWDPYVTTKKSPSFVPPLPQPSAIKRGILPTTGWTLKTPWAISPLSLYDLII